MVSSMKFADVISILSGDTLMLIDPQEDSIMGAGGNTYALDLRDDRAGEYANQFQPFAKKIFNLSQDAVNNW